MLYVIMCGGEYKAFGGRPKALVKVFGKPLVQRTIELLESYGIEKDQIKITGSHEELEGFGVEVIHHKNKFKLWYENGKEHVEGYWVNAFYRTNEPTCYLFGDVFYTEEGLKKIVEYPTNSNVFFGTLNEDLKPWEEPMAYKVNDFKAFFKGIEEIKRIADKKIHWRHPIVWELYRVLNGIPYNKHIMKKDSYVNIENGGMDVDSLDHVKLIEEYYG